MFVSPDNFSTVTPNLGHVPKKCGLLEIGEAGFRWGLMLIMSPSSKALNGNNNNVKK